MKNIGIAKGINLRRRYPVPTIEYEDMGDGRNYLCFVWWKWYFGIYWESEGKYISVKRYKEK